jgi:hypothetical protein
MTKCIRKKRNTKSNEQQSTKTISLSNRCRTGRRAQRLTLSSAISSDLAHAAKHWLRRHSWSNRNAKFSSSVEKPRIWLSIFSIWLLLALPSVETALDAQSIKISGKTLTVQLTNSSGEPEMIIRDLSAIQTLTIDRIFSIRLQDGSKLEPEHLQWLRSFTTEGPPRSSQAASEMRTCADLSDPRSSAHLHWCLIDRSTGSYMREQLTISAGPRDLPISEVRLLEFRDPQARVIGAVKGSPFADDHMFFGFEHPLSWSRVEDGLAQAGITRELPLRAGQSVTYSAVIATYPPRQLRRAFLTYLESERPRPYSPFLNYNTWYDIGYGNRFSEADVLNRIGAFGLELTQKRHVTLNSFVFDDGWDNPESLWGFNKSLPNGFTRVAQAAAGFHSGIGVWLSPWGGYDQQKQQRVAFGRSQGYEIIHGGFALSGPKYFHDFSSTCHEMIEGYHVNLFKFDGTGNANTVFPGSVFDSDFDAAIHLIDQIRTKEPGIFINLTTGTYPSPFWLFYADSIWRGGEDHSFAGVGTQRQRWITYRDEQTYQGIVKAGSLFPLNSLMVHGMIYAQHAQGLSTDPKGDFPQEVLSYFGSGTQLQEIYITPSLLTQADWDLLAHAASWSRDHATTLKDTHWIGGDPSKLQVYGWAAWDPAGWIVTLRNPSDHPQSFTLDLQAALELPRGSGNVFEVKQPFGDRASGPQKWQVRRPISVPLQPFEVRIFEFDRSLERK